MIRMGIDLASNHIVCCIWNTMTAELHWEVLTSLDYNREHHFPSFCKIDLLPLLRHDRLKDDVWNNYVYFNNRRMIKMQLEEIINKYKVGEIILEQIFGRAISTLQPYSLSVYEVAFENSITIQSVHPATLKHYATGDGRANKDKIIQQFNEFTLKKYNTDGKMDDIADSYFISHYCEGVDTLVEL